MVVTDKVEPFVDVFILSNKPCLAPWYIVETMLGNGHVRMIKALSWSWRYPEVREGSVVSGMAYYHLLNLCPWQTSLINHSTFSPVELRLNITVHFNPVLQATTITELDLTCEIPWDVFATPKLRPGIVDEMEWGGMIDYLRQTLSGEIWLKWASWLIETEMYSSL